MKILKFKILSDDVNSVVDQLTAKLKFDYGNNSSDMIILASEEFYTRNNSSQLNMVIVKRNERCILIDIIGAAGGTGLFNFDFWSEKGYLKKVRKLLIDYCEQNNFVIEENI